MEENNFWNFNDLKKFAEETKDEIILGKLVRIKRVSTAAVSASEKADPLSIIVDGLVEPKLTLEQLKSTPAAFTTAVGKAITEFSSIDGVEAEKN